MHVRELVELGALVAARGLEYIRDPDLLTQRHAQQYWVASRCRQDRWARAIRSHGLRTPAAAGADWPAMRGVIQEVLASELLTRTWGAVACCHDRLHRCGFFEPIALSILAGHRESRHRALQLVVSGRGFALQEGIQLNRLRRQTERWTDMLLGYLAGQHEVGEFAFSVQRARDFAADLRDERHAAPNDQPWRLAVMSLRAAFSGDRAGASPNGDLNRRIAASILACFHNELFDSVGMLQSPWTLRVSQIADDTADLVDDLLYVE